MKMKLTTALVSGALLGCAQSALAQEAPRFTWEGEIEIGYQSIYDSDVTANEVDDPYLFGEFAAEYALTDRMTLFGGLTLEEQNSPDSGIEDLGLYVHELGVRFNAGPATYLVGKFGPAFGATWDEAAGFFGGIIAEDYELTEMLGGAVDYELSSGGVISFALFYADDSFLSDSVFYNRGRNSTSAGGAGNTGKLNNASIQWTQEFGRTRILAGARYLSAGTGDVKDETGLVFGVGHSFDNGLDFWGEVAVFDGFGGTADDANYTTLNLAYTIGDATTLSGTYVRRDIDSTGTLDGFTVGLEYELDNGITLGGALGTTKEAGVRDNLIGLNMVIPVGG